MAEKKTKTPADSSKSDVTENTGNVTENTQPKTMEVDIAFLQKLQEQIDELKKQNEKLVAVSDKARLARYEQLSNTAELVRTAKISFLDGDRPVLAWKLLDNEVFVDGRGVYHETQNVELFFDSGESEKLPYLDSVRRITKKAGEILSRTKDGDGHEVLKIMLGDGREFDIDIRFVN